MTIVFKFFMILLTAASFAVIFKTPRRYFLYTVATGVIAGVGLQLTSKVFEPAYSAFVVTVIVAVLSHILAKRSGSPAQVFLIPGIILPVPGVQLYQSFSASMADQVDVAFEKLLYAIGVTCAMSFAILLANWIVPSRKEL